MTTFASLHNTILVAYSQTTGILAFKRFIYFLFYMHGYLAACMQVYHGYVWGLWRPKEVIESPASRNTNGRDWSCGCLEANPNLLQEENILLTAESSLQNLQFRSVVWLVFLLFLIILNACHMVFGTNPHSIPFSSFHSLPVFLLILHSLSVCLCLSLAH